MKRLFWASAIIAGISPATAMEADLALDFLQGTWSTPAETWIFDDQEWHQFNGGVLLKTTFEVEALPADMFVVISGETGRRYVVHANPQFGSMIWYPEGSTERIGYYQRRSD